MRAVSYMSGSISLELDWYATILNQKCSLIKHHVQVYVFLIMYQRSHKLVDEYVNVVKYLLIVHS